MEVFRRPIGPLVGTLIRLAAATSVAGFLAACQESTANRSSGKSYRPIPSATMALFQEKGTNSHAPVLIRTFKKEAELEIWKMRPDGKYAHIKTFPMCRWSGQLGPKTREGDRQVPEGFYAITPGQMNPNSNYYLSFNVGYPNAYDKAHGYTGGLIMVHGACSSAGCFSMTDKQIAEIYAIAREAFNGGQKAIQMQSLPFRMTPDNLAKHRLDPNMKFWKDIKVGSDSFELTKQEPQVGFCGRRYVFNAVSANGGRLDASEACPPLREDDGLKSAIAAKERDDQAKVAELVAKGVQPVKIVYADGGQHPQFESVQWVSRPEALAQRPVEIPLDEKGQPVPSIVRVAAAKQEAAQHVAAAAPPPAAAPALIAAAAPSTAGKTVVARAESTANPTPFAPQLPTLASAFTSPASSTPAGASSGKPEDASVISGFVGKLSSISDLITGSGSSDAPAAVAPAPPPAPAAPPKTAAKPVALPSSAPAKPQAHAAPAKKPVSAPAPARPKAAESRPAPIAPRAMVEFR